MKKNYTLLRNLFAFLLVFASFSSLKASHMEGADFRFRCLGGNQYEITLSFYRDCAGIDSDLSSFINIASASCGQNLSMTANRISVVEVSPLCASQLPQSSCNGGTLPGVQLVTYVGTITLPMACNDWIVSYSSCCRNSSITNISNPGSANMYVEGRINNLTVSCNNSPDFTTPPVPYICSGVPFSYNHGVVDPEGDSLRYTMIAPLNAAGTPLIYNAGYTINNPMNMTGVLTFDPATGQMTFTPNGPQIVAVAVRVDEYRNGVLIGSVVRDMQIVVINCSNNPPVANTPTAVSGATLNGNTFSTCPGRNVSFNITATDLNATDILTAVSTITANLPGAIVTTTGSNPINLSVNWTVPAVPLSSYNFTITFQDNACPIRGTQTVGYLILTGPQIPITASNNSVCPGTPVTLTASTATNYLWSTGQTTQSITVTPMAQTVYTVNGQVLGCNAAGSVTITMASSLPLAINANPGTSICAGQSVTLTAAAATNYSWSTGATTQSITVSPSTTTAYNVNGSIGTCPASGTITITTGSVSGSGVTVCQGGSGTISSSSLCPIIPGASVAQGATFNSGTLTTTDPTWDRTYTTCTQYGSNAFYYDVLSFTVSTAGVYTFDGCFPTIDAYGQLFQNAFDPAAPCANAANFITGNDDGSITCGADPLLTANLVPGVTYYLISTTYSPGSTDSYSWTYTGPAGATITPGLPGTIQWYTAASGGTAIGTGSPFNPVGVAGSGLANTNTIGTTTYYVACSGAPSCRAAVNFSVIAGINANIVGTNAICSGQSTTLTASGGGNYLWSTGATTAAITVSPTATTTYTATVSQGSCVNLVSRTVTVTTTPVPNPTALPAGICAGQSSTITASGGGTYVWNNGATTSSITVSPAATRTFSVTVNNGGCIGTGSVVLTVSPTGLPVINCPSNITLTCTSVATFTAPSASDPCSPPVCTNSPLSTIRANFNTNGAAITGAIPSPYNFTLDMGATSNYISDGGADMYDGGNYISTNLGANLPYTNGVVTANAAFGTGGQYFTQLINNMFVMAADVNGITSLSITGDNGADGSGVVNGFTYTVTVGCRSYNVFVKRVNGAGDPSINQIFIVPNGTGASHTFDPSTNNSLHTLTGLAGVTRIYYLLVAGNAGYAYTNAEIQTMVQNFLTQVSASTLATPSLTVTQTAGLPSGSTFPVGTSTVTYSATGGGGTSSCSFTITRLPGGPTIACPSNINLQACSPVATFATPTATDACTPPCANAPLSSILTNFNTNGASITGTIPSPYNFTLDMGATATYISDGGSDMYDGGNYLNTNIASNIAYTGGVVTPSTAFGTGGQYFTTLINNMFVMAADVNGITSFSITGDNGADGSGVANGFTYSVTVGCQSYNVFVKTVSGAFDPSINQIIIVPNGSGASQTFDTYTNNSLHTVTGLAAVTRIYYLLVGGNGGYAYSNAEIQTIVQNFLTQVNAAVAMPITVTQTAGLVSGSSFPVGTTVVTFQASSPGGTASCSFNVTVAPAITVNAGIDQSVCSSALPVSVSGTVANATGGVWTTSGTGTFANANALSTTYSPSAADITAGIVTLRLTSTGNGVCPAVFDELIVNLTPASVAPALTGVSGSICPNTTVTLTATGGSGGLNTSWYTGPNGTGTLLGTGTTYTFSPTASTTVYARRDGGSCPASPDASKAIVVKNFIYANNGMSTSTYCTDNAGWHHFYIGDDIILSVQGNLGTAGTVTATIRDNNAYYLDPANNVTCIGEVQFEMERNWNIQYTGTLSGTYNVRYYFQPVERTTVINAAAAWITANPACGYVYKYNPGAQGWFWFKNQGSPYSAPDYDDDPTFLMLTSAGTGTTPNGINWSTMGGLTNFSGGTGAVILIPTVLLSVDYKYFTGEIRGTTDHLLWATASETDNDYFDVEYSTDGTNFEKIGQVNAIGNSTEATPYEFTHQHPRIGLNYYRLRQVDVNGNASYSNVVVLEHKASEISNNFFPNPTNDVVNYQFSSAVNESVKVEVLDVLGRVLRQTEHQAMSGLNNIAIDLSPYLSGTYIIRVTHIGSQSTIVRAVSKISK